MDDKECRRRPGEESFQPQQMHWAHRGRDVGCRPYPIPSADSSVHTSVCIPVDKGRITLCGDLYIPVQRGHGPFPGIIEVTPYGAQTLAPLGRMYAARGYLFLAVDCRGRYRSEGEWEPLSYDGEDGKAVIAWLFSHELCNGRIGTRGHSYAGYNQLLAAIDTPPCLRAMVVGVAPGDPFTNTPFQGGAYDLNDLFWLLEMTGRVNNDDLSGSSGSGGARLLGREPEEDDNEDDEDEDEEDTEEEKEQDLLLDQALSARPFGDVDKRLGIYHSVFRQWTSHWQFDDYWVKRSVLPHAASIRVPTLFISGWWDGNGRGATSFYQALRQGSSPFAKHHRLLMGPWDHNLHAPDCDDLPEYEAIAIERGACRDSLNDEMAWFDHHLMDIPFGPSNQSRVRLFISGVNRWYEFSDWPLPNRKTINMYLHCQGRSKTLSSEEQKQASSCRYVFDPEDPTPFGNEDVDGERIPFDNSRVQKERRDIVLFDSAPFSEEWALIGPVSAVIYASSDAADFDITASLYDVYPDGRSIYLSDGILRARFCKTYAEPHLVPPGEYRAFSIDLWHLGHVVRRGHRLRLQVGSAAYLRFDVNPCTGGDLARETASAKATVTIHCGGDTPSHLVFDICPDFDCGERSR